MISKWFAGLALGFCLAGGVLADAAGTAKGGAGEEAVRKALAARFPGTEVQSVVKTAYGDLYEVVVDHQLFYTDGKASYFLVGNLIDAKSLPYLEGTELDYTREGLSEGFKFNNPNVKDACGCGESFTV